MAYSSIRESYEVLSVRTLLRRFCAIAANVFFVSLLIGCMGIAPVIYNMSVYDTVLPSDSAETLPMLLIGVLLALATEIYLRIKRSHALSYIGARLDHVVSHSVFERLLLLPPVYTDRASISSQVARLRDFDSIRDFFTGPLGSLFFELPLIAVYTIVMAVIAKDLAFVPCILTALYIFLLWSMNGRLKRNARSSADVTSRRQEFLLETFAKLKAIRLSGMEDIWLKRYKSILDENAKAGFNASFSAQTIEIFSYVLMTLGGIATLSLGVFEVINQDLSVGALIAAMILVWRIVSPLQICCASAVRLQQLSASMQQVQRLTSIAPESTANAEEKRLPNLKGRITFNRVSIRYTPELEPALLGVSFDIKPGQVVAIKGDNGAGKSTILKLILGLYTPQNGSVRLDGIDMRQFDPLTLRKQIAYVPQQTQLVPGTIRENLLLANPQASDEECIDALRQACALEQVEELPAGLDTVISGDRAETIPFLFLQRLGLARAHLRKSTIILFDEASHSLGKENDNAFRAMIGTLRGAHTIVMATHREDHMLMADQLLVLSKGELIAAGSPEFVLASLRGRKI